LEEASTTAILLSEVQRLQRELAELKQEKRDLEILLQTITEHADSFEMVLRQQSAQVLQEKLDLEILLETTTEHADMIAAVLQHEAKTAAQESERRLAQFLEAVPVGVFVVDAQGQPYYANQMAQQIFGEKTTEKGDRLHYANLLAKRILGKDVLINSQSNHPIQQRLEANIAPALSHHAFAENYQVYLSGTDQLYPIDRQPIICALQGQQTTVDDMEFRHADKIIPLEVWATPIFDERGRVQYAIAVFQDITHRKQAEAEKIRYIHECEAKNAALRTNAQLQQEIFNRQLTEAALQKANQELTRLAALDGLTQIANRRRLDEYLYQEWQRLTRAPQNMPLSFILCDIDYFKNYNDTYHHQAGDDCLRRVAQAINRAVKRPTDLVARYGGEEFAVILPNTGKDGVLHVARAIQETVRELQIEHRHSLVNPYVTLSIGTTSIESKPTADSSPKFLVDSADKALYEAKNQGRNRIVFKELQNE